jgi:hypothetical protein
MAIQDNAIQSAILKIDKKRLNFSPTTTQLNFDGEAEEMSYAYDEAGQERQCDTVSSLVLSSVQYTNYHTLPLL